METTDIENTVSAPAPELDELAAAVTPGGKQAADSGKEKITPPRQKGVPPKRPTTTSKRPATSTPSATTKNTPAAMGPRNTTGTNLNKPPARPTIGATARRPPVSTATAPTATSLHRPQPSTSSTDENKKPGITGTAKRVSLAGTTTARTPASKTLPLTTDRRPTTTPATTAERVTAGRGTSTNPTKPRSSLTGTTRSTVSSTPRAARPTTSSARGAAAPTAVDGKKRLSTIPASPAAKAFTAPATLEEEEPSEKDAGPARPPLAPRRSTKSVMLEQRLREYHMVSQMLQAAMAEADVDDEEKEDIARTADDKMAKLKTDLEKARAYEAKHGRLPTDAELADEAGDIGDVPVLPEADVATLESKLGESESKVTALQAEIEEMQGKMLEFGDAAQDESEKVRVATEAIRSEHISKIDGLVARHTEELEELHKKLGDAENLHKEHLQQSERGLEEARKVAAEQGDTKSAELLEEQRASHVSALEKVEQDLDAERSAAATVASQVEELNEKIKAHKVKLEETSKKADEDSKSSLEAHQARLQARDDEIRGNGQVIKNLEAELQALETAKRQEIEDAKMTASRNATALESEITSIQKQLQEAEDALEQTSSGHSKGLAAKDEEIGKLQQIVDTLKSEVSMLHESKADDLDATIARSSEEHERVVAELKESHESAIKALTNEHSGALDEALEDSNVRATEHEKKMTNLLDKHTTAQEGFSKKIEGLTAAKSSLEEKIEFLTVSHADELGNLKKKVSESEIAVAQAKEASDKSMSASQDATKKIVSSLEQKIEAFEKRAEKDGESIKANVAALDDSKAQVASLQKVLDSFELESRGKDDDHAKTLDKLRTEAAESARVLESKTKLATAMEESHHKGLKDLQDGHAAERKKIESELTTKHESALKELQLKHDELLSLNKSLSDRHAKELETLKANHSKVIGSQTQEVESIRTTHTEQLSALTKRYEEANSEYQKEMEGEQLKKMSAIEANHAKALESLSAQHEDALASVRQEVEDAGKEKSTTVAKAHVAAIAELKEEIHTHKEALTKMEQDLHRSTTNTQADAGEVRKYKAEIEELRKELADSKKTAESVTAELKTRLQSKLKAESDLQEASKKVADLEEKLAQDQESIKKLTGVAEEASKVLKDGAKEADQLRETNEELMKEHDAALAKLRADLNVATEGRTAAEKGHTATKEELKKAVENLDAVGTAEKEMKNVQDRLQKAMDEAEVHRNNHEKALLEVETLKADTSSKDVAEKLDEIHQNLKASNATNATLVQQLQEAEITAEQSKNRIRELESKLKVTAAELTETQTKRASGMDFLSSPKAKSTLPREQGLQASQGADQFEAVGGGTEGEEIGSSIEGTMASIQEQLRQLGGVNEDMFDGHMKIADLLRQVPHSPSHPPHGLEESVTAGDEDDRDGID